MAAKKLLYGEIEGKLVEVLDYWGNNKNHYLIRLVGTEMKTTIKCKYVKILENQKVPNVLYNKVK